MKVTDLMTKLLILLCVGGTLSACNTTRGIGEDVEAAGEAIEESAEEVEDEID